MAGTAGGATIGIDLGGTRMRVGRRDAGGRLVAERTATPESAAEGVARLVELARRLAPEGVGRVGLSAPGPLDRGAGTVSPLNLPGWHGFPLVAELAGRLGAPVALDNDANVAALGEWREGAGRGARAFVYYTVSTGVGSGVILDGRIHHGAWDTEGGHQIVWPGGPACRCGARGCLEAVASGTALRARYGRPAEELDDEAVWDEVAGYLAVAMANTAALLCPDVIAIGGGLTARGERLFAPLRRRAAELIHLVPAPRIVPAGLGQDSGLVGALGLAESIVAARS
ncbi:MAG TPA: ROK family protein [Thermomicrobiales bacterium]|nr:ROK family protein [Thermomicrobiales bacterium]